MNGLRLFEHTIEDLLEGKLSTLLGGRLQPMDIANCLTKALEDGHTTSIDGYSLAPNRFTVFINPKDHQFLEPNLEIIQEKLCLYLTYLISRNEWRILGSLQVAIRQLYSVPVSTLRVSVYTDIPASFHEKQGPTNPIKTVTTS